MGPLIAIVGSDGSGKSTVGEALLLWLQETRPAALCHLGKQSGNMARAISGLPLFGSRVERAIEDKAKQVEALRCPGPLEALTIFAFTLRRFRRFKHMLRLRQQGVTILADRFPQLSIPAGIDGPGFGKVRCDQGLARRLAIIERRAFEWMTSHRPDLVLRLNVDLETAISRKPDHRPASLAAKVAAIPKLVFSDAPIVDIDATRPISDVIADARLAISQALST